MNSCAEIVKWRVASPRFCYIQQETMCTDTSKIWLTIAKFYFWVSPNPTIQEVSLFEYVQYNLGEQKGEQKNEHKSSFLRGICVLL